jgi:ABC-type transport system substrate-binding protein
VNFASLGKVETAPGSLERRSPGGSLHVPIAGLVRTLDPALTGTVEESEVFPNVFETLTRGVGGSKIVPWLAAEVRSEEGGRRYRFRLRDDVRFHDGRRLTARDVRYSLERLLQSPDSDARGLFSAIRGARPLLSGEAGDLAGLRILSASEFTIELEEPVSFFPALLSYEAASILPEGGDVSGGNWQRGCVGTGPFRVVRFEPGRRLELERNRDYWRPGYPRSESLTFSFGVEPREILSEFRSGRFSIAGDLFPEDAEALRRDPEFASGYVETPRLSTHFLAFNVHRGPLQDLALRQALARAVDVPALVRRTLGRLATPAHSLIPPGLLGHDAAPPSRAAGPAPARLPSSLELTAALNPAYLRGHSAVAGALTTAFREIGVSFSVVNETYAEYADAMIKGTVDVVFDRWIADFPDSDSFAHQLHTREGTDGRMCGAPELDRLIERGRSEPAPALRHSIYREIEERIGREALILPLFHEQVYRFARPEVEGLSLSVAGSAVDYASLRARD